MQSVLVSAYDISVTALEPIFYIKIVSVIVLLAALVSLSKKLSETHKKILFLSIAVPVALSTLYLAFHTITDNASSATKGPVHWHADYEVMLCGKSLDLINPNFHRNKIGTSLLHEHDDNRIHVEGTVSMLKEVSLGNFFKVIGGKLENNYVSYPTKEGLIEARNGEMCDNKESTLKVYINGKRMSGPENYVPYPAQQVPPGDCIIILFDSSESETTDIICTSWKAKGWDYDGFDREENTIGDIEWQ